MIQDDIVFRDVHLNVLVADDSTPTRHLIARFLRTYKISMTITEVDTGQRCFDELASNAYDVALIDVNFPDGSGLDALRKARDLGSKTFVVVMSSFLPDNYMAIGQSLQAYDFLVKPLNETLIHSILDSYGEVRSHKHVLIIDDSATARKMMRKIMDRGLFALTIEEASDGVDGFELFVQRRSDVVFVDINMRGLDGPTTMRLLRAIDPGVKVVLISSSKEQLAASGAPFTLHKPFSAHEVDAILYSVHGLRPAFSGASVRVVA